jgi:hypothetical protein
MSTTMYNTENNRDMEQRLHYFSIKNAIEIIRSAEKQYCGVASLGLALIERDDVLHSYHLAGERAKLDTTLLSTRVEKVGPFF